ncbi:MAG: hypothetical protein ACK5MT_06775 [Actinomycetales bacterium]
MQREVPPAPTQAPLSPLVAALRATTSAAEHPVDPVVSRLATDEPTTANAPSSAGPGPLARGAVPDYSAIQWTPGEGFHRTADQSTATPLTTTDSHSAPVQRADQDALSAGNGPGDPARADSSASAPASPPGPEAATVPPASALGLPTGPQLEELAARLFDPLATRLRAELWLDRERAGLIATSRWY